MNGRTFLKLTLRDGADEVAAWSADSIIGVHESGDSTKVTFVDGSYVRVTEDAATVLAMSGARVVTALMTKGPTRE